VSVGAFVDSLINVKEKIIEKSETWRRQKEY
jgi:hypothetical protein